MQKRGSSSHTNNNGEIVTAKGQTISLNKDSTTRVTSQFKTITTLFVELVKTNTSSFDLSLSSLAKRLPFQNVQTDIPKDNIANKKLEEKDGVEVKTGIPSYFDIMGRKKEEKKEAAIPQWKIKRKAVSQESVDARTKHVVSAVAKAVTKSSLLVRLEDFCHHLFQYPAAKSVASRVRQLNSHQHFYNSVINVILIYFQEGAISILLRLKHSIPRDELIQRQIREGLALLGYADPLPAKGIRILSIDGGGTRSVNDTRRYSFVT